MTAASDFTTPWWDGTAIYQIYVRSFQDSNGDGIGDLPGVKQRLGDLQDLGVRTIWLTPFFPSPNADFGYDVADYCGVAPEYGTLADWDALIAEANQRGIRVLVDLVLNHSSHVHPWFQEARSSRNSPKRDWYVWRDGKPDGSPPTNWRSVFGGPAWTFDAPAGQWYYHAFLSEQPDLNWHHPAVREAMWDVVRFWLKRGASGFRLDATAFLFEDPAFEDDPTPEAADVNPLRPHNACRPENHGVLRELRQVLAEFPGDPVLLGESSTNTLEELVATYGGNGEEGSPGDEVQLPMNFLYGRHWQRDAAGFKALIDSAQAAVHPHTPVFFFSNHDHPRQWSAFGDGVHNDDIARLTAALTLAQRGTGLLYMGEEVGMGNLPAEELAAAPIGPQRPRADFRDQARTPMQWSDAPQAGFTTGEPWLPLARHIGHHHVAAQKADAHSLWHWYRALLTLKQDDPVFRHGEHVPLDSGAPDVLAFGRRLPSGEGAVVLLNWSDQPRTFALTGWPGGALSFGAAVLAHPAAPQDGVLPPFGAWLVRVTSTA